MNDDTITIDLSSIQLGSDMTTGTYTTMNSSPSTITLNSGISIGNLQIGASNPGYTISTPYDDMETRLARLEKIIAEEDEVRKNHPAVQMAYDEYRLLYILAKKNAGDRLTDE